MNIIINRPVNRFPATPQPLRNPQTFGGQQALSFGAKTDPPSSKSPEPTETPPSRWERFWKKLGLNQAPQSDEPYNHIPEHFTDFLATSFMNDQRVMISGQDILGAFIKHQAKLDGKLSADPEFELGKRASFRGLPVDSGEKSAYFELLANQFGFQNKTSQLLMFRNLLESGVLAIQEKYVQDDAGHTTIERAAILTQKAVHLYHERTLKGAALKKYLAQHADFFQHPDKPSLTTQSPYSEPIGEPGTPLRGDLTPAPGWQKRLGIALAAVLPIGGVLWVASSQNNTPAPASSQPAPQVQVSPTPAITPQPNPIPEMAAGRSAPKTDIQGANTPPSPSRPFSNRLTSVEAALQDFKAGRFEPVVTELPHHNGYSSFVFQEKGRAVPAPVKGNPKATRVEAGPKVYLPDVPTAERPRLQQGIEEAKGSIQTSSAAVESTSGPTTVVAPSGSSNTSNLLTGLIVALMAANLIAVLASRSGGKNSELAKKQLALMERQLKQHENMEKFGQAAGSSVDELPETRLDDVGGNFVAKEELRSIIRKIKRRMNGEEVMIPKGILLEGPPGNGKTLMARAVAGEAGIPFYSLSGSEFNQMFVGVGASRVRDVFARAKENAPAIIFIDEIDAIAQARSSGLATHRNEERESTLTELLRQMDGFEASENVFVLAATNRKDVLDSALTDRPSRFKYSIFIDNPRSDEERQEVLAIHQQRAIKKLNVRFPETVDGVPFLTKLAQVTRGLSGDKLQHVILEAAEVAQARAEADYEKQHGQLPLAAKIEGYEDNRPVGQVSFADCIEAYQKIQYGHLSKVKHSLPARRKVGFHEHGHNILAYALHKLSPMVISMLSRDKSLGRIILDPTTFDEQLHSQSDLLGRVLVYMGGTAGEEFEYGKGGRTTGNSADVDSAQSLVVSLISHGLLDDNYAVNLKRQSISELSPEEKDQLNRVIRNAKQTALTILNAIGKENLNRMVEESLACDHEMVGEEATAFNQRHLDSHWDRIHTLAQAFLDNPEGKSVS